MKQLLRFFQTGEDKPVIQDKARVDELYHRYRMQVLVAITLGYGLLYTCRLGLSVVKKPLIDGGIFTANDLGLIGSATYLSYAFGKLTNGFLADHANIKRFFAFSVLMSALINIAMGWSMMVWAWVILWALNGWFQGFGGPASVVSMSQWYSNKERGRCYGIWSTAHSIGEGLTFVGAAALVSYFGWRAGFVGPGIICILTAIGLYIFLKDRPRTMGLPIIADWKNDHGVPVAAVVGGPAPKSTWQLQLSVLKFPAIWVLALASATMYMTRYAINSWGMLYLQEAKGYTDVQAGGMLALNPVAGLLGCVAYGFISDKFFAARRPPVNLLCAVMELGALSFIFFSPPGHPVLLTIAFMIYGFSLNGLLVSLGGLFAVDIAPKRAAGAVAGFIGIFSYLGAAGQEQISGLLIARGTTIVDGVRHYDFSNAIIYWMGASVVSMLLAASLWRTKVAD